MATVLKVLNTYHDSGDAHGQHSEYVVQFDSAEATSYEARHASDGVTTIPSEGSYLTGTKWRAKVRAERNPDVPTTWTVTVDYASVTNETKATGTGVSWNVQVTSTPQSYDRPVYQDVDGAAIVNAAGYPFQQQPTITDYDSRLTVSFSTNDGNIINDIRETIGRVNSDPVTVTYKGVTIRFEPETLRFVDYTWGFDHDYASDAVDETFKVSLTFDERKDGWKDLQLENSGFYDANGKRITEKDINSSSTTDNPVVEAVLLDASGAPLADGSTAVPLEFTVKEPVAFGPLLAAV
jgi:hypothetical protein